MLLFLVFPSHETTSRLSPEIVDSMIGGVWGWRLNDNNWTITTTTTKTWTAKMSNCPLPFKSVSYPWTSERRSVGWWWWGLLGEASVSAAASLPSSPPSLPPPLLLSSLPSFSPSLLSLPEGFLALKHCIRAPPTGHRNFTATDIDEHKPRLYRLCSGLWPSKTHNSLYVFPLFFFCRQLCKPL